jgi:ABC-type bacteriocin/lantibiotic exporter with double-glycine peptidase domain
MQFDQERPRIEQRHSVSSRAMDVMVKVAAVTAGAIMLVSALVLSIVFVLGALAVLLVVGGYFWWRTREVRKQMREQMRTQMRTPFAQGDVIEGVVVRDVVAEDKPEHRS